METTDASLQENVLRLPLIYGNCPITTRLEWNQYPQIPPTELDEYLLIHKSTNEYWYSVQYLDDTALNFRTELNWSNVILWARLPKIKC